MSQRSVLVPIREAMLTIVPALALVVGGFWLAWSFVPPPPPKKLVIGAASKGSPYYEAALRYADFFKARASRSKCVKPVARSTILRS